MAEIGLPKYGSCSVCGKPATVLLKTRKASYAPLAWLRFVLAPKRPMCTEDARSLIESGMDS